jgi:hypothetical protein
MDLKLFVVGVIAVLRAVVGVVPMVERDGVAVLLQWVLTTSPGGQHCSCRWLRTARVFISG